MTKFIFRLCCLLIIAARSSNSEAAAQDSKPLKVFVLAGQSNMVGAGAVISELPPELKKEQENALFFSEGKWIALVAGRTEKTGFGPEIAFGHKITEELKMPIGIIKHSIGGTNLAIQWSPTNAKSLYTELIKKVNDAKKIRKIEIVGMLWMQGEADSKDQKMATSYAGNLQSFIRRARKDLANPELIFVAGRVNPPTNKFPFEAKVRKAIENCKEPNYAFIDCDNFKKGSDNLHYTTSSLVDMGNAFADSVIKLIAKKKESQS
jgi:hypothetical protein